MRHAGNQFAALSIAALLLTGCSSASQPATKSVPTVEEMHEQACNSLAWPQPVPNVEGMILDQALRRLNCFNVDHIITADGTDTYEEPPAEDGPMRVNTMTPPGGTPVKRSASVKVHVVPVDSTAPQGFTPCNWVSTDEVDAAVGAGAFNDVTTDPINDEQGSVSPTCTYNADIAMVTVELDLPNAYPVSASWTFSESEKSGALPVDGLGERAACADSDNAQLLRVLLPRQRILMLTGWAGTDCSKLASIARSAIPRLP